MCFAVASVLIWCLSLHSHNVALTKGLPVQLFLFPLKKSRFCFSLSNLGILLLKSRWSKETWKEQNKLLSRRRTWAVFDLSKSCATSMLVSPFVLSLSLSLSLPLSLSLQLSLSPALSLPTLSPSLFHTHTPTHPHPTHPHTHARAHTYTHTQSAQNLALTNIQAEHTQVT